MKAARTQTNWMLEPAAPRPLDLRRVVVVGASGAGKTTFGRELARRLNQPCIELDALHWEKNWTVKDANLFRDQVGEATAADQWVMEGGYRNVRDLIWTRATAAVWLDYSFRVVFARALRRTIRRVVTGEEILNGNRETFRLAFLSWDGIPYWVIRSYWSRRQEYRQDFARPEYAHLHVARFARPREANAFLDRLSSELAR